MRRTAARLTLISIAVAMVAIIAGLSMTGQWPGHAGLEHFTPNGLIAIPADEVARVEVGTRTGQTVFQRVQDRGLAMANRTRPRAGSSRSMSRPRFAS